MKDNMEKINEKMFLAENNLNKNFMPKFNDVEKKVNEFIKKNGGKIIGKTSNINSSEEKKKKKKCIVK